MKLLFLSHYFKPEGNAPASRTYEHCKRWVAAGHEVTVITSCPNVPHGRPYEGYRNRLIHVEWMDGIRVVRVWTFLAANKGTVRRTLNYLSYWITASLNGVFTRKVDVVVATSPQFFCGLAGVIVSRLRGKPFVLEVRDIWPESIEAVGATGCRLAIKILAWLERRMYFAARHIICVGNGYRDKLMERGVGADKISVITNGADLSVYKPGSPDEEMRAGLGLEGKFVVAYIGTLGMACGLDCVLDAGEALRREGVDDVVLLMAGDGARREELEFSARERGLENVRFSGHLAKDEIPALLRSVDVCLVHLRRLALFQTVLPSKIFEAFATSKPVIIGVPGEASAVVRNAGAGIEVPPEDAGALVKAIRELQADPSRAVAMGACGRKAVESDYDRDVLARRFLKVVEERVVDGAMDCAQEDLARDSRA